MTKNVAGVYMIVNYKSNKAYIGSSINIDRRIRKHFTELRSGKHHCIYLQRSWNKHGPDCFGWELLDVGPGESVIEREQRYLDANWKTGKLYNTCSVAGTCAGLKHSKKTRELRASKLRGSKRTPEQCARISAARKATGITAAHQKLLNEISARRRFVMTAEDREIFLARFNAGETWKDIAASIPINIKAFRREIRRFL